MTYWLDLFTPYTWTRFQDHGANISGFRPRQRKAAFERVKQGDKFLCNLVRLQRWCGILEISGAAFEDTTPIFADSNDPFSIRFNVNPVVTLDFEHSIPIAVPDLWAGRRGYSDHVSEADPANGAASMRSSFLTPRWRGESRANSSLESGVQGLILAFYSRPLTRPRARAREGSDENPAAVGRSAAAANSC